MKEYKRENMRIPEFDKEDVIMTPETIEPITPLMYEHENRYGTFKSFSFNKAPGAWFDD